MARRASTEEGLQVALDVALENGDETVAFVLEALGDEDSRLSYAVGLPSTMKEISQVDVLLLCALLADEVETPGWTQKEIAVHAYFVGPNMTYVISIMARAEHTMAQPGDNDWRSVEVALFKDQVDWAHMDAALLYELTVQDPARSGGMGGEPVVVAAEDLPSLVIDIYGYVHELDEEEEE